MSKCVSQYRDKNYKCVDCGVEIYDGFASIVLIGKDGQRDEVKQRWVTGHVE